MPFKLEWFIVMLFPYLVSLSHCHCLHNKPSHRYHGYIFKLFLYIYNALVLPHQEIRYYWIFSSGRINTSLESIKLYITLSTSSHNHNSGTESKWDAKRLQSLKTKSIITSHQQQSFFSFLLNWIHS